MAGYFVTGSGTDIGKTFVCCGLARRLRGDGRCVEILKPIVSGFDPEDPVGSDPAMLLDALDRSMTPETLDRMAPWRFRAPLSPDMAATAEGRTLDVAEVAAFCRKAQPVAEVLLIEGAGGVMVPLNAGETQLDLMRALALPVIFVGGSYLGALSHALTGLASLRSGGLEIQAVIVNETPGSTVDLSATVATLQNFAQAPVLALRRDGANAAALAQLVALLAPAA